MPVQYTPYSSASAFNICSPQVDFYGRDQGLASTRNCRGHDSAKSIRLQRCSYLAQLCDNAGPGFCQEGNHEHSSKTSSDQRATRIRQLSKLRKSRDLNKLHGLLEHLQPHDVKEYNVGIIACGRLQSWQCALSLLHEMRGLGLMPDAISYNVAILACDKVGQWQPAISLLQEMRAAGTMPNVISWTLAISACEKGGQWQNALALFDDMRQAGVTADAVSFNAAMLAGAKDGQWQGSLSLLEEMHHAGISPTLSSFNAAVWACEKGEQWEQACWFFDQMRKMCNATVELDDGATPDIATSSQAIDSSEWTTRLDKDVYASMLPYFGETRLAEILRRSMQPPASDVLRVNTLHTDRSAFLTNLCKTGQASSVKLVDERLPEAIVLPRPPPKSVKLWPLVVSVDRICGEHVLRGASVYAPGLKRIPRSMTEGRKVSVIVDIEGKDLRGQMTPSMGVTVHVGNGIARMDRDAILKQNQGLAIEMTEQIFVPHPLAGKHSGEYILQNLPSIVAARLLAPQPGDRVLDMCAAPGGKTTHLAMLMQNSGELVACDRSEEKVGEILANAKRFGITCIKAQKMDVCELMLPDAAQNALANASPVMNTSSGQTHYPSEYFDRILLDPTCSALGLRPCFVHNKKLAGIVGIAEYQRVLIYHAVKLLKPGGVLVYSTCTWNPPENEGNVAFALSRFPLKLLEQELRFGDHGMVACGLSAKDAELVQRFDVDAGSRYDTIGFFIAKFEKTASFADNFR